MQSLNTADVVFARRVGVVFTTRRSSADGTSVYVSGRRQRSSAEGTSNCWRRLEGIDGWLAEVG